MIKFITESEELIDNPTFGEVEVDQFFVVNNSLYQKYSGYYAHRITDSEGNPYFYRLTMEEDFVISRILPKVIKIEF